MSALSDEDVSRMERERIREVEDAGFEPREGYVTIFFDGKESTQKFRFDYDASDEEVVEKIGAISLAVADSILTKFDDEKPDKNSR